MPKTRTGTLKRKQNVDQFEEESSKIEQKLNNDRFIAKIESDKSKRLEYLLEKTSLYGHFVSKNDINEENHLLTKRSKKNVRPSSSNDMNFEETPYFIKNGVMKEYQIEGLNWLISLYNNGLNGILADEMGLGKTLQSISILGYLKNVKKLNGPFLVLAPKSTISSWVNEISKWCPSLRTLVLIGHKSERENIIKNELLYPKKWDVCLTTYEICMVTKSNLKQIKWCYFIVDEAHRIKNENSNIFKTCRSFNSINRLLLTGTPLQNNLHELWALLNFLLPDIFDSSNDFDTWFDTFDCLESKDKTKKLHSILMPFMLQRFKQDVENSLLPKKEITIYVGLSEMQRECYKKILKDDMKTVNGNGSVSKVRLANILMHLFKAANHPYIFPDYEPSHLEPFGEHLVFNSGKMMILDKLLRRLKEQGSRVVIFGHFARLLDILEDFCHMRDYKYLRLGGSTSYEQRENDIKKFNSQGSDIFLYLISTTAGGLGINLQSADVAILLESHFNPQVDLQAIDRVHRIGQKKQVRVFRIISENTVEEKLIERAKVKLKLNEVVILNQKGRTALEKSELIEIIRFGTDKIFSKNTETNNLTITDADIDAIMQRCENNTTDFYRLEDNNGNKDNNNNMENKSNDVNLEGYFGTDYIYNFEGENYRKKYDLDTVFEMPQRRCRSKKFV
ncbi:chromatin-remodeling complex ATPase chain Iswi-like [Condylostylus longicornis]|uniref:chromatin-remodeling complex ATPase chain Iswi-like n=1 Tax=Condylostylus longicornis TaxID=2530218 RepID=UPI00244E1DC4|nr:chromatin-remodeling complex ATPase chain Iswi-like [Condylostylus longicornis]